jgi:TPR repeat protein
MAWYRKASGQGVEKDEKLAFEWMRRAANSGDPLARKLWKLREAKPPKK